MRYAIPPNQTLDANANPDTMRTPVNPMRPLNFPTPIAPKADVIDVNPLMGPYHVELSPGVSTDDTKLQCCDVRSWTYDSRNTNNRPTTYLANFVIVVDAVDDDDGVMRSSNLPMSNPDPVNPAAHQSDVLVRASPGPYLSNTTPYQSSRRKLTGDMNVIARGYAVDVPPPPPKPSRDDVNRVIVAGRARL